MKNQNFKSIILLSGGLDSLVSLGSAKEEYNIITALTFNYGQKSAVQEIKASENICRYYSIEHKIIELIWLAEITQTSLVNKEKSLPDIGINQLDNPKVTESSAKTVWVPNRNGIFLNIAAGFADSYSYQYIIFGANKEEASTFSDNSQTFIGKINQSFEYSTLVKPKVIAPLGNLNKTEIVKKALAVKAPLELVRSCYTEEEKHCGNCESCLRFKRALIEAFGEIPKKINMQSE